ncbi:MAG TPA: translation elongation factor 4 [Solirubrobacteraceae bacterium]|nr:translation elongation factor 4 [Solirubrobacteraceae bacterium]
MDQKHIRNFCIVAHIDHGKSTLADRILELTHTVDPRTMRAQLLDSMDLERERGITIKAQAVRVFYDAGAHGQTQRAAGGEGLVGPGARRVGQTYQLHLIDTPGHVDFTYEVSRSLAACEGALLVVDAAQGVEAQTVANTYLAIEAGLELIPCLNKIDLPGAEPERVAGEVSELIGESPESILKISGKTGAGVPEVLEELIRRVPPPAGDPNGAPRALIFDSEFDQYRGVIAYIRVVDGVFKKGEAIRAMAARTEADIDDIGVFSPQMMPTDQLAAGEVGYLITGLKDVTQLRVGDTLTVRASGPRAGGSSVPGAAARPREASEALPGYREVKPMVFCGLFPIDSDDYPDLRDALEKLTLNDAALSWEPETSDALGFGFRCGFLGLLHMDIVRERLEREYDLELLATMPSVGFEVTLTNGSELEVHNPSDMPDPGTIAEIREPFIKASIITPKEHVGAVMELCQERRGEHTGMHYLSPERVQLEYELPLAEIVLDFFDQLKSRTKGYASLDYELSGSKPSDLVKLDVLLAGDPVDALSMVVHREKAYEIGRTLAEKLRKRIPRQQYDVPIQAAIGSHIIARETVKAFRKDVIAKCYGGDITRKKKLLAKQKEGKKRMKQVGRIEVPQEAFLAVLELGEE